MLVELDLGRWNSLGLEEGKALLGWLQETVP
jgi:hypothetical protein